MKKGNNSKVRKQQQGLSLIQKIQPVQTSRRSDANSSQMTNRTQKTRKTCNKEIICDLKESQMNRNEQMSISTELNLIQPAITNYQRKHDISQQICKQNQFIDLELLNNSYDQKSQFLIIDDECDQDEDGIQSSKLLNDMINCQESSQILERTIEKSLQTTQMQQILTFSEHDFEDELSEHQNYENVDYEEEEENYDQYLDEEQSQKQSQFQTLSDLPLEQLSRQQLLKIMQSIPSLLSNEINRLKQMSDTNQTMEQNNVQNQNDQDQLQIRSSNENMNASQNLNDSVYNIYQPPPDFGFKTQCGDLKKPKKVKSSVKKQKVNESKEIYNRIKQLNNEKYLLLRQLCIQKQIDSNTQNSSIKQKMSKELSPIVIQRYQKTNKSTSKSMKSKSRKQVPLQKEHLPFTQQDSNQRMVNSKNQTIKKFQKHMNRTLEDQKKIKKSKQMLASAEGIKTLGKQLSTINKENYQIGCENFINTTSRKNKEIDQLTNRYNTYLQNCDSKKTSFVSNVFSSRKRSQRSQRSFSKSKRGSQSKSIIPMRHSQLFEYGSIGVNQVHNYNVKEDLSNQTTERKYNIQKNKEDHQNKHESINSEQTSSFLQKQDKCQCSFKEPVIEEYEDIKYNQNIRCEINDWTDQEQNKSQQQLPHIPTAEFFENENEKENENIELQNDYEDEPLLKRTYGESEENQVIQLKTNPSEEEQQPLNSYSEHKHNEGANNFMTANYEHNNFLEYEDYVCKSSMFDNNIRSNQKSNKISKSKKTTKGNKKSKKGSNRSLSRNSSVQFKKDDKINYFISDSLQRKSQQRKIKNSRKSRNSSQTNNINDHEIELNQQSINLGQNGQRTQWFGNQSDNSIKMISTSQNRRQKSHTRNPTRFQSRSGSLSKSLGCKNNNAPKIKKTRINNKQQIVNGNMNQIRESSLKLNRQLRSFGEPRLSNNGSVDTRLNTQRVTGVDRKWNPFFNQNKSSNHLYSDSFREININILRSHRIKSEQEMSDPIQRLLKFKIQNEQQINKVNDQQKWFQLRKPMENSSCNNSLPRNAISENTWRNDTKIILSGQDTNSLEENNINNVRKSRKEIQKIAERLYNPQYKSQTHNQSTLNTIQDESSPLEKKFNKQRNQSQHIQNKVRQNSTGHNMSRSQKLDIYTKNKMKTHRIRAQSLNSIKSKQNSENGSKIFKALPFVNKQPFVVMKSTKKLTVPKGRQMFTQRQRDSDQQMVLKKAYERSNSKSPHSSIGSGSKLSHFGKQKTDDSRPMGYKFDDDAFYEYNNKNFKYSNNKVDIENSLKKFDNIVNSFGPSDCSLNLKIDVLSQCYPDDHQKDSSKKENQYTNIGEYIQMKEGDVLQRSGKYLNTDMPCVFSFGNTLKKSILHEQVKFDTIIDKEKQFIRSHRSSSYHNEYLTDTRKQLIESQSEQVLDVHKDFEEPETTNDQTQTCPTSRREINPSISNTNTHSNTCSVIESVSEPDSSKKTTQSEKIEIELMQQLRQQCFKGLNKNESFDLQNQQKIEKELGFSNSSIQKHFMNLTQGKPSCLLISGFQESLQMIQSSDDQTNISRGNNIIENGSDKNKESPRQNESIEQKSSQRKPFDYKEMCTTDRIEDSSWKSIEKHKRICSIGSNMTDKTIFNSDIKTDRSIQTVVNISANVIGN